MEKALFKKQTFQRMEKINNQKEKNNQIIISVKKEKSNKKYHEKSE